MIRYTDGYSRVTRKFDRNRIRSEVFKLMNRKSTVKVDVRAPSKTTIARWRFCQISALPIIGSVPTDSQIFY
jgi:hypothetical protein